MGENPTTALTGGYSTTIPRTKHEVEEVFDNKRF